MVEITDQSVHGGATGYSRDVSVRSSEKEPDLLVLTVAHLRVPMSDWPTPKG
jgi:hypothetical protein